MTQTRDIIPTLGLKILQDTDPTETIPDISILIGITPTMDGEDTMIEIMTIDLNLTGGSIDLDTDQLVMKEVMTEKGIVMF